MKVSQTHLESIKEVVEDWGLSLSCLTNTHGPLPELRSLCYYLYCVRNGGVSSLGSLPPPVSYAPIDSHTLYYNPTQSSHLRTSPCPAISTIR